MSEIRIKTQNLCDEFLTSPCDIAKIKIMSRFLSSGTRILDLPCGTGNLTSALGLFGNVVGVDLSKARIRFAKKSNHRSDFILADAHYLPFIKRQFDLIAVKDGFEHFQDDCMVLSEICRISDQCCELLLYVPVKYREASFSTESLAYKLMKYSIDDKVGHVRRYSSNEITTLLQNVGFQIQKKRFYAHLLVGLISLFVVSMRQFVNKKGGTVKDSRFTHAFMHLAQVCLLEYKIFGSLPGAGLFIVASKNAKPPKAT